MKVARVGEYVKFHKLYRLMRENEAFCLGISRTKEEWKTISSKQYKVKEHLGNSGTVGIDYITLRSKKPTIENYIFPTNYFQGFKSAIKKGAKSE